MTTNKESMSLFTRQWYARHVIWSYLNEKLTEDQVDWPERPYSQVLRPEILISLQNVPSKYRDRVIRPGLKHIAKQQNLVVEFQDDNIRFYSYVKEVV